MGEKKKFKKDLILEVTQLQERVKELETANAEQKQALETLSDSERRFKTIFTDSVIGIDIVDVEGSPILANRALLEMLGYSEDELRSMVFADYTHPDDIEESLRLVQEVREGKLDHFTMEKRYIRKDGAVIWGHTSVSGLRDAKGNFQYFIAMVEDITERKQAMEALLESEDRYRAVVENSHNGILIVDEDFKIEYVNESMCQILGRTREEIVGYAFTEFLDEESEKLVVDRYMKRQRGEEVPGRYEFNILRKDGGKRRVEISSAIVEDPKGKVRTIAQIMDITERAQAEKALGESEEKLRLMVDNSPTGFSSTDMKGNFLEVNPAMCLMVGYSKKELLAKHFNQISHPDDREINQEMYQKLMEGKIEYFDLEKRYIHKTGKVIHVLIRSQLARNYNGEPLFEFALVENITERKLAEKRISRFSRIFEDSLNEIYLFKTDTLKFTQVNPAGQNNLGYTMDELYDLTPLDIKPEITEKSFAKLVAPLRKGEREEIVFETIHKRKDGSLYDVEVHLQILRYEIEAVFSAIILDITERKRAKDTMQVYTNQLETLNSITAALSTSLELDQVLDLILDQIGQVLPFYSGAIFLSEEGGLRVVADRNIKPSVKGDVFSSENELFQEIKRTSKTLIVRNTTKDHRFQNWGQTENVVSWMGVPLIVRRTFIGYLTLDSNQVDSFSDEQADLALTFAAQAAQAIENANQVSAAQQRMKQLDALLIIDQAIMGSLDLEVTLNIILKHLLVQLAVDAAAVLSYQADLQALQFAHCRGFQTPALQYTDLSLGKGYAGEVGLQRESVFIPDLNLDEGKFKESPHFSNEGFVSYYGVPLVAKGKLVGVLEIFNRSPLDPRDEWVNYLQLLASQIAIAIDNITLFNDLQRTNVNLTLAYDATIEGWAHALELKDVETEGHSRRVVELAMNMARRMGVSGEKLAHVRRGALLHDIGKMGVPDSILQKPGKLTDNEWQIMRQHPVYAFEWLSPIQYLQPALEIPYAHHERWDGTGYPRGMEGEQIPLAARIFAIVDVWDALNSDRPYRKAWSRKKIIDYIREESGKHFDPAVVDIFLETIESDKK